MCFLPSRRFAARLALVVLRLGSFLKICLIGYDGTQRSPLMTDLGDLDREARLIRFLVGFVFLRSLPSYLPLTQLKPSYCRVTIQRYSAI